MARPQGKQIKQAYDSEKSNVSEIIESEPTKKKNTYFKHKYQVNLQFESELEESIRERAEQLGLGVATYIKSLVKQDLANNN